MRVGVYIDGFNLYYGGRSICGRGAPGWRWLDLRALAERLIAQRTEWRASDVRVVYCTARIRGSANQSGQHDQDAYLRALVASSSVDVTELGTYVTRTSTAPLAVAGRRGKPQLVHPAWPLMVKGDSGEPLSRAVFMASVARREEKGSDVNVASHLLIDTLGGVIDAAIVISNDSDLAFPLRAARKRIPVGTVNPTAPQLAGALKGLPDDGAGGHWWYRLAPADFTACQLPASLGRIRRPTEW